MLQTRATEAEELKHRHCLLRKAKRINLKDLMTSYSNSGFFNHAYHDSETLEIDRRKTHHTNPYATENPDWWGDRADTHHSSGGHISSDDVTERVPRGGWRERESIPMGLMSTGPESPSWQHDPRNMDGVRWRSASMRRMSMSPNSDPSYLQFTEDAIRTEMENEEQSLVKELVALSTRERIQAILDLPISFGEKKHIRSQVLAFKSSTKSRQITCFSDCSESVSLTFRRCSYGLKSARQTLQLWQGVMKEISGRFGTSVLSYFIFLKWLLVFNIFSFLINFGFITIPLLVYDVSPNIPANVSFRGLEILTGVGYLNYTIMYYGGYSNETIVGQVRYNMQLAYFFTIAAYMVLCGFVLVLSMAILFKKNYVLADIASESAWQLLCSWDFSITNERAVRQRKNNLRVQLRESLSEKTQKKLLTLSEKLKHIAVYLGSWFLSTSLALGCGGSIYYLCLYEHQQTTDTQNWTLLQEAKTLLVPFVVSLMNLVFPLLYSLFNRFEHYSSHRRQIYALVVRNVFLKMSILGVLCYYWMNVVADKFSCWESMVGQAVYRLVIFDFLFLMLGSFFGEFLSNVIGTRLLPRIGVPEFDVARNVLELIYAQTLAWIGIYFSPLLPAIQILKLFILFYLKKVSLTQNCQPPRQTGRAAQMQTIFIALLFFPFFVGALSMVAYISWSLTPSEYCGPFRGLNNSFSVVVVWTHHLEDVPGSQWVIWIYQHVVSSEIFYFIITLIILIIIYILWQVTQGRKELIVLLRQLLVNEGKDKAFLLDKLQNLQKFKPNKTNKQIQKNQKKPTSSGSQSNSSAMAQALLARQQFEDKEVRQVIYGVPVPADISPSSALIQALKARQRAEDLDENLYQKPNNNPSSSNTFTQATHERDKKDEHYTPSVCSENLTNRSSALVQAMHARQRAEEDRGDDTDDLPSSMSGVMMQVMQVRQRAEEEDRIQWAPAPSLNQAPSGSSALIQAMLARQQAQNEFDDGY
ncbi:transmembrane channel-like protein 5 isoform X2 [Channa argus]|uniref:transmembrane channel-like protein 5 isoform X2 n=1 Tax=Channa argus TaxID=215402 RepID=UPI0035220634